MSAKYAPIAAKAGCVVIDNTSHFRMEPDVPLVVPEVNPLALKDMKRNIIANPNCSTIQMVVALKPLHDLFTLKRVVVSTYQAVSGAGKDGMDELFSQTRGSFVNDPPKIEQFQKQIAFNCIPQIDRFMDDGATKEEWKMRVETKKFSIRTWKCWQPACVFRCLSVIPKPLLPSLPSLWTLSAPVRPCGSPKGLSCSTSAKMAGT